MSTAPLRIYHNPRCSKSRSACALIAENGIAAEVVEPPILTGRPLLQFSSAAPH